MDEETKDILMLLLEKMNNMDKKVDNMDKKMEKGFDQLDKRITKLELINETEIMPTLQLILENQTEVINQKSHITVVESKHEELKDRVDVIEYAVQQNQNDMKELKKRA